MEPLFWLLGLGVLGWFWYDGLQARERAVRAAVETCRRQDLQFLDGSVNLRRLRLRRGPRGSLQWLRLYQFEYSEDAVGRQTGFVVMGGQHIETVGLAAQERPR